ncbi:FAD-linked oxidoreductase ZEB1 [Colletotrichum spaethianum]|uniref:FAD-linked oxidoreductase ZEB1 n=1 Tax=Colletotrichum spaethianum TaxID=700344 RepID=A0AA37LAY0_9PEZI|nr:FAD-linked oxidoreductase ZEB1 [Colletotrichum spaethianum]GKT41007.1 FAD-linked oxidoreductase ZEB1 [Colletotrichum spaethianum]
MVQLSALALSAAIVVNGAYASPADVVGLIPRTWQGSSMAASAILACTLGYYSVYAIKVTRKQHIKAGVDFDLDNNLRLIIRNTGHDFIGRSTG